MRLGVSRRLSARVSQQDSRDRRGCRTFHIFALFFKREKIIPLDCAYAPFRRLSIRVRRAVHSVDAAHKSTACGRLACRTRFRSEFHRLRLAKSTVKTQHACRAVCVEPPESARSAACLLDRRIFKFVYENFKKSRSRLECIQSLDPNGAPRFRTFEPRFPSKSLPSSVGNFHLGGCSSVGLAIQNHSL